MKSRLVLNFSENLSKEPVTFNLVKKYDLSINILKAEILPGRGGELLIEVDGHEKDLTEGIDFLQNKGVRVEGVEKRISFNEKDCINCGACTAVCFSEALVIERPRWELKFDSNRCVACGLCVKSCPLKLFSVTFGS